LWKGDVLLLRDELDAVSDNLFDRWSITQGAPEDEFKVRSNLLREPDCKRCFADAPHPKQCDDSALIREYPPFKLRKFAFASIEGRDIRHLPPVSLTKGSVGGTPLLEEGGEPLFIKRRSGMGDTVIGLFPERLSFALLVFRRKSTTEQENLNELLEMDLGWVADASLPVSNSLLTHCHPTGHLFLGQARLLP
jgi:hypothetical protein